MEPGPTERHESDTAAATTPANGTGAVGVPPADAAAVPPVSSRSDAGEPAPPRPRTRRGWMSDSPLDGGSGWPTSAYAIIPRPASVGSVNGSANATAGHQGTAAPDGARPAAATQSAAGGAETRPGQATSADGTRQPGRFKLPKQKSRRLGTAATQAESGDAAAVAAGRDPAGDAATTGQAATAGRDMAVDAATSQGTAARRAGTQGTTPSQAASSAAPTTNAGRARRRRRRRSPRGARRRDRHRPSRARHCRCPDLRPRGGDRGFLRGSLGRYGRRQDR